MGRLIQKPNLIWAFWVSLPDTVLQTHFQLLHNLSIQLKLQIILYLLYYIILYYIILYFNSPRGIKSKDFVQFIFLYSSRKTKSKDFLQLTIMIFLLWISFKNIGKSVFCNILPSIHHIKSILFYHTVDAKLPPRLLLKSPN